MSNADHSTRTLLIPKSAPDLLLVSRGSNNNLDNSTVSQSSGRSMIKIFNLTTLMPNTDYTSNGVVLGWGLRNSVGVGENPNTGEIVSNADTPRQGKR
jgi:glucose/arabinose dehydrogenase